MFRCLNTCIVAQRGFVRGCVSCNTQCNCKGYKASVCCSRVIKKVFVNLVHLSSFWKGTCGPLNLVWFREILPKGVAWSLWHLAMSPGTSQGLPGSSLVPKQCVTPYVLGLALAFSWEGPKLAWCVAKPFSCSQSRMQPFSGSLWNGMHRLCKRGWQWASVKGCWGNRTGMKASRGRTQWGCCYSH